MTTTALILSHYLERIDNVERIIKDLHKNEVKPDKIVVFFDRYVGPKFYSKDVTIIQSTTSFPVSSRLALGSMMGTDYVWAIDDDLSVLPGTLDAFYNFLQKDKKAVVGFEGQRLSNTKSAYTDGRGVVKVTEPTMVDIVLRTWIAPVYTMATAMSLYHRYQIPDRYTDDLMLCLTNSLSLGNANYVLPSNDRVGFYDLNDCGVGQCREGGHYSMRNAVCHKLIKEYIGDRLCTSL